MPDPHNCHAQIDLDQLKSVLNEACCKMTITTPGILNEYCQTFSVVGYPCQTCPNDHTPDIDLDQLKSILLEIGVKMSLIP